MANLLSRLSLKIDTYASWTDATVEGKGANLVLNRGEIGLCEIPANSSAATTAPTILFKVGDGVTAYKDLKWASALAADVYAWAKASTVELTNEKLSFKNANSEEIYSVDLSSFATDAAVASLVGGLDALNTTNKNNLVSAINEVLAAVEVGGTGSVVNVTKLETPSDGASATYVIEQGGKQVGVQIDIPMGYDDSALAARVKALEDAADDYATKEALAAVEAVAEAAQTAEEVATAIETAIDNLNLDNTYDAKGSADAVQTNLDAEITRAKAAEEANATAIANEKTRAEAAEKANADAITAEAETARAAEKANADAIDAIEADYLKAADKTELQGNIDAVGARVTTLVGDDAGKSVRTIANEELAAQLIPESAAEALDTLAEIAAWIQEHPGDAAAMNAAIAALEAKVDTGDKTVTAYVTDAINALAIGDYAKAADLTALAARVTALETASADHATKAEVEAVANDLTAYETAHAEDYTNDEIDTLVDGVDAKVAAINHAETGILAQAKAYADGLGEDYATAEQGAKADAAAATIATHGDIVTHNADEFATAAQGAKADSAIQSEDMIPANINGFADAVKAVKVDAATAADKATADGNGKNIADTYATKEAVAGLTMDDIGAGSNVWVINCGSATEVI